MNHHLFDKLILSVICISALILAAYPYYLREYRDDELSQEQIDFKDSFDAMDILFTVIFLGEFIVKVIAMGFFWRQ
jgi:hypothetical protein